MERVYNFSPGPAMLPTEVLQQAQEELLSYQGKGFSIMEVSHRHKIFIDVAKQAEVDLRKLLDIPEHYKVLFLQGGGRSQFAMVPLNLLRGHDTADYVLSGHWSQYAVSEAKLYCKVNVAADGTPSRFTTVPPVEKWNINPKAAYLHYIDNETVDGVEFPNIPEVGDLPLVCDMSSNILSRPFDIERFACVYASAQKNIGPSGLAIVIVREDYLGGALPFTPTMFNYTSHAKKESMLNTPPTFSWYLAGLVFQWLLRQGGVASIAEVNKRKSEKLYHYIDRSEFYVNSVDPHYRSRMNVVFRLKEENLTEAFIEQAAREGLCFLKGHKSVGGIRASLYNPMPEAGVDQLIAFMQEFVLRHSKHLAAS